MSISAIQSPPQPVPAQNNGTATATLSSSQRVSSDTASPAATAAVVDPRQQSVDTKQLEAAVKQVQHVTQTLANELKFNIDQDTGKTIVKLVDTATGDVIRQIPSEEMLVIAKALDKIQGLLIKQEA